MTVKADKSGDHGEQAAGGGPASLADAATLLFAHQAAALATMTAYGFSLTSQMSGLFFGAMADAVEKSRQAGAEAEADVEKAGKVVPLTVVRTAARPAAQPATTGKDDLKRIPGIGPRLEKALNGMGITRYAQLAAMGRDDMQTLDAGLGLDDRVIRDDWAGKAKALLEG